MAGNWQVKLIQPSNAVREAVYHIWSLVTGDMHQWMEKELVPALVYGGLGINGINHTPFYQYVTSPDGISELGIEHSDAEDLLRSYVDTIKISHNNRMVFLRFGDIAQLKLDTPHPAANQHTLNIQSWLEWIVDGTKVADAGFVPRENLPSSALKFIRTRSAAGGLMLPRGRFGSTGAWAFPKQFANYDSEWLASNAVIIENIVANQAALFFTRRAA